MRLLFSIFVASLVGKGGGAVTVFLTLESLSYSIILLVSHVFFVFFCYMFWIQNNCFQFRRKFLFPQGDGEEQRARDDGHQIEVRSRDRDAEGPARRPPGEGFEK